MSALAASGFLKALGWALVNSLWQFAICWIAYFALTTSFPRLRATVKHSIALSLLALGSLSFLAQFFSNWYQGEPALPNLETLLIENTNWFSSRENLVQAVDTVIPWWSVIYLAAIGFLFTKLGIVLRQSISLRHKGISKLQIDWRLYIEDIAHRLGIHRPVQAFISANIDTPQVLGYLKPIILIPAACLANLTTQQMEAVLLHELVHIKRNDYVINLFVATTEIIFFFNPFARQLTAQIRKEREYSCDDMVLQFRYPAQHYAAALLILEKNRLSPVTYGIAASGKGQKQLLTRIERLLGLKHYRGSFVPAVIGIIILLVLGFAAGIHPSPAAITGFGPGTINLPFDAPAPAGPTGEGQPKIINDAMAASVTEKVDTKRQASNEKTAADNNVSLRNDGGYVMVDVKERAVPPAVYFVNNIQKRDYSLLESTPASTDEVTTPDAEIEADASGPVVEPFVPSSSFSFQVTQDTGMKRVKGENYQEHRARESKLKMEKLVAELDWRQMEKNLKLAPAELAKLKKMLGVQLQKLNWERINAETQRDIDNANARSAEVMAQQDEMLQQYQRSQWYYEEVQKKLAEQSQLLSLSKERAANAKNAALDQQRKLESDLKKHKIIDL